MGRSDFNRPEGGKMSSFRHHYISTEHFGKQACLRHPFHIVDYHWFCSNVSAHSEFNKDGAKGEDVSWKVKM